MGHHVPDGREGDVSEEANEVDALDEEDGRLLFAKECCFVAGSERLEGLPEFSLPEVAFAGRSNVGKSSLLNALTNRSTLARVSNTPGRTRQLNFFDLGGRLLLVDMPGYGYAEASKADIKRWQKLIDTYLSGRPTLARVMLLVDARHGLKATDRDLMKRLDERAVSYQVALTKSDQPKASELEATRAKVATELAKHPAAHPDIVMTSATTGLGMPELRARLAKLAAAPPSR
ncbi:MAG: YihA family ribosome biogenesis GTP-binding protein [Alphaproteobacteria bacterium]|nr:YihA family ribosome biogenesis GTP-binding protein [Alphaproteobacteria bacterium]